MNDAQIAWRSYRGGLAQAKAGHKPICLRDSEDVSSFAEAMPAAARKVR